MMHAAVTIAPWPALLTLEGACRYLSLERAEFLALAARWKVEPVDVGSTNAMWRTRDLDALLRRLPTLKLPADGAATRSTAELDQTTIDRLAQTLAERHHRAATLNHQRPPLVSIKDGCLQLGLGRSTIYRMINDGSLQVRKIGRRTLVTQESIDALIDR